MSGRWPAHEVDEELDRAPVASRKPVRERVEVGAVDTGVREGGERAEPVPGAADGPGTGQRGESNRETTGHPGHTEHDDVVTRAPLRPPRQRHRRGQSGVAKRGGFLIGNTRRGRQQPVPCEECVLGHRPNGATHSSK
ncbi:hypothetical protein GCM10022222_59680 [Amycolatopsis ultiminotia]|uniref:Uncharacterized protein n=1 Tax=Amycolatopsis ultiminotia TaxID=543629 RepID=A0ABP6XJC2_9PSEU